MITFVGNPPSSALVNSSVPALSLPTVESSFSPVSYAVPVNTLWLLSLTLSLISAFFAITVQQWLRQLRLPPEMPVRRAIQLLATRSDGLKTWQVPSIISLLPLLLQIAVILFLAGLFLLLQSLNTAITIVFGVVALVGLLAFLATTVIPLITPHCPYKSPLVPTAVVALQCLSYPLAIVIIPVVFIVAVFLNSPLGQPIVNRLPGRGVYIDAGVADFFVETLIPYVESFGRHITVDMGRFWLSREHRYIFSRDENDQIQLEASSLAQVLLSIPSRNSVKVMESLHSFRDDALLDTIQDMIIRSLRAFRTGLHWLDIIYVHKLDPQIVRYVRGWLSTRHHRLLRQYLHQRDGTRYGDVAATDSELRIVFHELDRALSITPQRYAKNLLHICAEQQLSKSCSLWETIPACLVLDLFSNRGYGFDQEGECLLNSYFTEYLLMGVCLDVVPLLGFTAKVYNKYCGRLVDGDRCRLLFVATILALVAVHQSGTTRSAEIVRIVNMLSGALDEDELKEAVISKLLWYYDHTGGYLEVMSPAKVMGDLCGALYNYALSPLPSTSPEHLAALTHISITLRAICSDTAYAHKPEMQEARGWLGELDVRIGLAPGRSAMVSETISLAKAHLLNSADVPESTSRAGCRRTTVSVVAVNYEDIDSPQCTWTEYASKSSPHCNHKCGNSNRQLSEIYRGFGDR